MEQRNTRILLFHKGAPTSSYLSIKLVICIERKLQAIMIPGATHNLDGINLDADEVYYVSRYIFWMLLNSFSLERETHFRSIVEPRCIQDDKSFTMKPSTCAHLL